MDNQTRLGSAGGCLAAGANDIPRGLGRASYLPAFKAARKLARYDALIDQDKQTTPTARHRAHARVTSMEDLIAETPADDIEGIGIKLALYVYMSGVDPETADSAVEKDLSADKDCGQVLCRDLLVEVKSLMPAWQQGV